MTSNCANKPIQYHPHLQETFDDWASACDYDAQVLKQTSEHAIRCRHHEATVEHESHRACNTQPDIFTLSLDSVSVFYTVEPDQVMIRGYGWEIDHEPLDDYDGGGFYAEPSW